MARRLDLGDIEFEDYEKPSRCDICNGALKYSGLGEYVCNECGSVQYDDYGKVRIYLEKNPGATLYRVENETGVSAKIIRSLVRDGKFDLRA